ncbi:MAG: histidine triad nucleotide-binding protein [Acidimicrobiales bacterium]
MVSDHGNAAQECIFCMIAAGAIPADIVMSNDTVTAFRDLNPQAPVHVLVVPRRHIENAATLEPDDSSVVADMLISARKVAEVEGILDSGYRLVFNIGSDANNTVPHLHLHVIGGRSMSWPPG